MLRVRSRSKKERTALGAIEQDGHVERGPPVLSGRKETTSDQQEKY